MLNLNDKERMLLHSNWHSKIECNKNKEVIGYE